MTVKQHNNRSERTIIRRSGFRNIKQTFLIICEGAVTEPEYFNSFRLTSANVHAVGKGLNTLSLVNEAIKIRKQEKVKGRTYDQYWVVFDKDDFPDKDFNDAIKLAEANGFNVAYSNQAFEYWFLLHFNLYQGPLHRDRYGEMLTKLLGFKFTKSSGEIVQIFSQLFPRTETAISNAKKVMETHSGKNPAKAESSTTVYRLVGELLKFIN